MRINFNDGQEVVFEDLSAIPKAVEKQIYDRVIYEMLFRATDSFFADSLKASFSSALQISVAPGLGFQNDSSQTSPEPTKRPLYRASATALSLAAAHPSLDRIDILVIKHQLVDDLTQSRKFKDAILFTISNQNLVVRKDWQAELLVVTGTPAGSPAAPATPSGYLRIASMYVTANTGMSGASAVTDERAIFNYGSVAAGWDAVVGAVSGATHASLAAALASLGAGKRIMVASNETINSTIVISNDNTEVYLRPGVILSKGSATTGIQITGDGCKLNGGKLAGFTGGGNKAIQITGAASYTMIRDVRFANGTATEIDDLGTDSSLEGNITES